MTSRRAQIARMRQVALAALDRYPLPDGRLRFVTHGDNTTFRHDSAAGRHLVRVHRPQRHVQQLGQLRLRHVVGFVARKRDASADFLRL